MKHLLPIRRLCGATATRAQPAVCSPRAASDGHAGVQSTAVPGDSPFSSPGATSCPPSESPPPRPPRLFLFDLDGTLIDSRADIAAAANRMRALHGLPPLPLQTIAACVGGGIRALARLALAGADVDLDLATAEIDTAYAEHLADATRAYAGVDAGLRALHAAGHALALVTNKPATHTRRLLDHFQWTPLFSVILGEGDTPEIKPSPLPLQIAMQRTGHSPANAWMVGDHHTDLEAARRAGVRSIFLESGFGNPGDEKPDLVFPDFADFAARFLPPDE